MSHRTVLWGRWFERGRLRPLILTAMLDLPLLFHMLLGPAHHLTPPAVDGLCSNPSFPMPAHFAWEEQSTGKMFLQLCKLSYNYCMKEGG